MDTLAQYYDGNGWYNDFTNECDEWGENDDYDMVNALIVELCGNTMDVKVQNFGWRNTCGTSTGLSTENALAKILPNCECSFKIRVDGKRLMIDNSHHDSPVGGEIYTITATE